jgi:hypothetical protein
MVMKAEIKELKKKKTPHGQPTNLVKQIADKMSRGANTRARTSRLIQNG